MDINSPPSFKNLSKSAVGFVVDTLFRHMYSLGAGHDICKVCSEDILAKMDTMAADIILPYIKGSNYFIFHYLNTGEESARVQVVEMLTKDKLCTNGFILEELKNMLCLSVGTCAETLVNHILDGHKNSSEAP